jgi:hypothetical protein
MFFSESEEEDEEEDEQLEVKMDKLDLASFVGIASLRSTLLR